MARRPWPQQLTALLACMVMLLSACGGTQTPPPERGSQEISAETNPLRISGTTFPLTITDFHNRQVRFDSAPQRVCLISGTPLNIWYDLGGTAVCGSAVTNNMRIAAGRERAIKQVPAVGRAAAVNVEDLASYKPDLVVTVAGEQDTSVPRLQELGFRVISVKTRSLDELSSTYLAFGALLGRFELAQERVAGFKTQQDDIVAKLPKRETSVVIVYVTSAALAVKLDNSIAGQMSSILKLKNIASGMVPDNPSSETAPLDIEAIVEADPDYVLVTSMVESNELAKQVMATQMAKNPAWQAVGAVRAGKIVYLPQQYFLLNAGPYYGDALEFLAASVYPDVYGEPKQIP